MKFDNILGHIGEFGPYQKRVYFLAVIPTILVAFETVSTIFIFNFPPHRCRVPGLANDRYTALDANHSQLLARAIPRKDGAWDTCHVYTDALHLNFTLLDQGHSNDTQQTLVSVHAHDSAGLTNTSSDRNVTECDSWVFDHSYFESTIATDFGVVCGRSVERADSNMISEVGALVGTLICGFVADRFGRKIPFYVGAAMLIGGGFGIAFTQNMATLNICRFVLGIARIAVFINGFVSGVEIVGPSKRVFTGIVIEYVWCTGELLLLVFAYFIRQWRYLEIALSVPSIALLAYWWLLPESPRWLVSKGRTKEATKILHKIAVSNGTKMPAMDDFEVEDLFESEKKLSFRHVLTSRTLFLRMTIVYSNMTMIALLYYGLTLNITNLGGDIFVNFFIMVLVGLVGYAFPFFLLDRLGRKPVYCTSIMLASSVCLLSIIPVLLGAPAWVINVICMAGRMFVCSAFGIIYIYGAEVFPTVIRASTMGIGVTVSRLGSLSAPYLADLGVLMGGRLNQSLPLIVMGTPALLVGLTSLWLPETKGDNLPETMEDLDKISTRCCPCGARRKTSRKEVAVNGEADGLADQSI